MQPTALIVDDNEQLCELFSLAFNSVGFSVQTALNGYEALDYLEAQPYDVMILDVDMPGMSGLEVMRAMQTMPNAENTRVILATGNNQIHMHEDADLADLVLLKPISFTQLVQLADRLLKVQS